MRVVSSFQTFEEYKASVNPATATYVHDQLVSKLHNQFKLYRTLARQVKLGIITAEEGEALKVKKRAEKVAGALQCLIIRVC